MISNAIAKSLIVMPALFLIVAGCTLKKPLWKPAGAASNTTPPQTTEINAVTKQNYTICSDCLLLKKGQNAIHAAPESIKGLIESILLMDDKVQFQGWAANVEIKGPIDKLLIFANDHLVYEGSALIERLDVARAMGDGAMLRSGFSVILDKSLFIEADGKESSIGIFALTKDMIATKLPFKQP